MIELTSNQRDQRAQLKYHTSSRENSERVLVTVSQLLSTMNE